MDVRIGVTYTAKELDLELEDGTDPDAVRKDVEAALTGDASVLWLTDKRGRSVGVPSEKIAYVEIGSPNEDRRIGFGS
ncbi:MAG TPA: DUF3107 domain-containing protein [Acidimicrobiales bacterium]|nr:DUF3107 domain-containing protein [Acidimicrobiales bacterium]